MSELTPTRSALLSLREDRRALGDGYRFLDEKRLLLAARMLRELERYRTALEALRARQRDAAAALRAAVQRHGLEGVQCYPAAEARAGAVRRQARSLLGLVLVEATLELPVTDPASGANPPPVAPSPEAARCAAAFRAVLATAATLAAHHGNLRRLRREYRATERRARALENVLLPELDRSIAAMDARLEELDLEDAVRVRLPRRRGPV